MPKLAHFWKPFSSMLILGLLRGDEEQQLHPNLVSIGNRFGRERCIRYRYVNEAGLCAYASFGMSLSFCQHRQ